jgi:sulfite reductase (ferredoxin)
MARFRAGIENLTANNKAIVEHDILELADKIHAYKSGTLAEDKFKALRLARGVYGQRQLGVQMIRIKLPFGKVTPTQLRRIASVSDEYSTGHLHITTRQDIQIHYVSLDRTPQLWEDLERDDVTLREACGNTVRNVTASATAGIEKNELFDVSPYADLVYRYFLRKPFGQELGRKIKIAFSATDLDDAYSFIHDFGFIPKIVDGIKGFKVLVGGGLGAQPFLAKTAYEFLPAQEIIPFIEASIRIFDRHGERNSRNKARLKYLIQKIGFESFITLVEQERPAVQFVAESDYILYEQNVVLSGTIEAITREQLIHTTKHEAFKTWLKTNVFEQKQEGYYGVFVKVLLGNFNTEQARKLADIVDTFASKDIRFTIDQNILLKFVKASDLETLYTALTHINLSDSGWNSVADITACPGTDTCNLGISNSTEVASVLEDFIKLEYPELVLEQQLKIKISGCMNSCGQHGLAQIGLHGSSIKTTDGTVPALQLLLGGGNLGNGQGKVGEKVIKFPSKRVLAVFRTLFDDYFEYEDNESFNAYYDRVGNRYFYDLLKPLADTTQLEPSDYIDWGNEDKFKLAIGVGECAGVLIDLVETLLIDAREKLSYAETSLKNNAFADSVYHSYAAGIHAAKAILIFSKVHCNTHIGVMQDFDKHLGELFGFTGDHTFTKFITQINQKTATKNFAHEYFNELKEFIESVDSYHKKSITK